MKMSLLSKSFDYAHSLLKTNSVDYHILSRIHMDINRKQKRKFLKHGIQYTVFIKKGNIIDNYNNVT